MLQVQAIGHLGGDAVVKNADGREFTSFRIAHSQKFTGQDGQTHEQTQWVDCVINGRPNVLPWLVKGQQVFVSGDATLRVYDSEKDRCKKAGLQVRVRVVELVGKRPENGNESNKTSDGAPF